MADAGPLISSARVADRELFEVARRVLESEAPAVLVPWPVAAEVDYVLRKADGAGVANAFFRALMEGDLELAAPTPVEAQAALGFLQQYADLQLQLADAIVMALADSRDLPILTWDFRDFRAVRRRDGRPFQFVVQEHEVPGLAGR